ncbi:MAG: hypothetical protein ACFE9Z_02175 [Promethearchaeota archaeon]
MAPNKIRNTHKISVIRLFGIIVYLAIFIFMFYFLITLGFNPFIIFLFLFFIVLATIGLFFGIKKKKIYSRMFSKDKNIEITREDQNEQVEIYNKEQMIPRPVNLGSSYRKPLIDKCKHCGNIVPNFVKKCPFCNKNLS